MVVYAVCRCHTIYPPTHLSGSSIPVYPACCSNSYTRDPMPWYLIQDWCQWERTAEENICVSWFQGLSHKPSILCWHWGIDGFYILYDDLCASLSTLPRLVKNPFKAQLLQEFWWPDLKKLSVDWGEEGHYAFVLHVNFFNPEGMSLQGPSTSSGIISMPASTFHLSTDINLKTCTLLVSFQGPNNLLSTILITMCDLSLMTW